MACFCQCIQKCIQHRKSEEIHEKKRENEREGTGTVRGTAPSLFLNEITKKENKERKREGNSCVFCMPIIKKMLRQQGAYALARGGVELKYILIFRRAGV